MPLSERQLNQLYRRREVVGVQYWGVADNEPPGARGGFLLVGQAYTDWDRGAVHKWLYERWCGYPTLAQFEGGANWPALDGLPGERLARFRRPFKS